MRWYVFGLLALLFCIPTIFGYEINNTYFNTTAAGSNISLMVNATIYTDANLTLGVNSLYFPRLKVTNSSTEGLTFNISTVNTEMWVNDTRYDPPHITSSSSTAKIVTSALIFNQSVNAYLDTVCRTDLTANIRHLDIVTINGLNYPEGNFTCIGGTSVRLDNVNIIASSTNQFTLRYKDGGQAACINMFGTISNSFTLAVIALIVIAASLIIGLLLTSGGADPKIVVTTIIVGGIMILIGYYLLAVIVTTTC
jgi:hypothetical protein